MRAITRPPRRVRGVRSRSAGHCQAAVLHGGRPPSAKNLSRPGGDFFQAPGRLFLGARHCTIIGHCSVKRFSGAAADDRKPGVHYGPSTTPLERSHGQAEEPTARLVRGATQGLAPRGRIHARRTRCRDRGNPAHDAYYEGETEYPPTHLLPRIAQALHISADELLGIAPLKKATKPRDSRLQRRLQQIEGLSVTEKRQVLQLLDAFIERGQLKRKAG